jgi:hypothetical protein
MNNITPFKWYRVQDVLPPLNIEILTCYYNEEDECFFDPEISHWKGEYTKGYPIIAVETSKDPYDWVPASHWMLIELPKIEEDKHENL